ncbi:pyridoxamine 5'-phosphate oxidase family protein [Mycolicibacterium peregrinum]|uniref:Pyridoxamine 5'-phosphate oxidase n=1 Tax=Mycolicibacterium peregrinum TaxID=43304 RepID=A0A1A0VCT0_MYCPR|nr:pyridoxamine 5'-phosphate oxidase family protein [Mycolicibacterium peregrinum]OBB81014.1 pyridoxamine 5'-phosphate oxidase [Mycolicibacterium peregrinum]OBF40441.1 pyridoxamine 5'-phosphate oxidase [Mycolicibacterium peregrinum]
MNQIRRERERARTDRPDLDSVLDAASVGTLATVLDGQPWVVPMLYARDGDRILLHGSTGAGALRHVAAGAPAAFCVTLLDGIVVADTLFDSTANYRSAVVRGNLTVIDPREAAYALDLLSDSLIPGRSSEVRASTKKELVATLAVALPITPDGWTVKVRDAPPAQVEESSQPGGWAGVVPLRTVAGDPVPAAWVSADVNPPESVCRLVKGI